MLLVEQIIYYFSVTDSSLLLLFIFDFFFLRMKGFISYNMHVYLYKSGKYQITKEINL